MGIFGHSGHHHHDDDAHAHGRGQSRARWRIAIALAVVVLAIGAACLMSVTAGTAVIVTRFGDPVRVLLEPGLAWKLPPPLEERIEVDLRLHTTSSGLQDVGTRDGLRIIVQAYVAWRVPAEGERVRQFVQAVGNQPDEAARQLRSFLASALEVTASGFDLSQLINTDPAAVELEEFEKRLGERLAARLLDSYGVSLAQVGVERLTLPPNALSATVWRMLAERETAAAERTAEGNRIASEIRSNADRDARILVAQAQSEAARVEAEAKLEAAEIYGRAYESSPSVYMMLRSLDTLDSIIGGNTRLILRTDAAPFNVLVDGPGEVAEPPPAAAVKPGDAAAQRGANPP